MSIDVRMINLYKFHVPKTHKLSDIFADNMINRDGDINPHEYYFTMGHYDIIDIVKIDIRSNADGHVLERVYADAGNKVLPKNCTDNFKKSMKNNFSHQKQFVFTDVGDGDYQFSEAEISEFWGGPSENSARKDGADGHNVLFVSMLHINDCNENGEIELDKVLTDIKACFKHSGMKYLYYFTFDYSDIILFCKTNDVPNYLKAIIPLDYYFGEGDADEPDNKKQYIRDSFSFYGICRSHVLKQFEILSSAAKFTKDNLQIIDQDKFYKFKFNPNSPTFYLKLNIGIQNGDSLKLFMSALNKGSTELEYDIETTYQLGRHDFSITSRAATLNWYIFLQWLIDCCTTAEGIELKLDDNTVFRTFESFIGCDDKLINNEENGSLNSPKLLSLNTHKLRDAVEELGSELEKIKELNYYTYYTPVQESANSVSSIMKNKFAEDFVICMYESFLCFIKVLKNKLENYEKTDPDSFLNLTDELNTIFNKYFMGLNALTNSGMHNDRSFIQATDFNAIFYDVPPKLMAFYSVIIYRILDILRDSDQYEYAFLFTPDFSSDITVQSISSNPKPEHRVLLASINERFFYNPPAVISTMSHEAAHFVGDHKRVREYRMDVFIRMAVYALLDKTVFTGTKSDDDFFDLSEKVYHIVLDSLKESRTEADAAYSYRLIEQVYEVCVCIYENPDVRQAIFEYYNKLEHDGIIPADLEKLYPIDSKARYLYTHTLREISDIISDDSVMIDRMKDILSVFKEAYSDMQMVLILGMNYSDYIDKLFWGERISADDLTKNRHFKRIVSLTVLMRLIGAWGYYNFDRCRKCQSTGDNDESVNNACSNTCEEIKKGIEHIESAAADLEYILSNHEQFSNIVAELSGLYQDLTRHDNDDVQGRNFQSQPDHLSSEYYYYIFICDYLAHAMRESLTHFSQKLDNIQRLRDVYNCIKEFSGIKEVYECVEKELASYKVELSQNSQSSDLNQPLEKS